MTFKFSVGEKVKVVDSEKVGEVIKAEHKHIWNYGNETISKRYLVQFTSWLHNWFDEDRLEYTYEITDESFGKIVDMLIDTHLKHRQFDVVKKLCEEKKLRLGE